MSTEPKELPAVIDPPVSNMMVPLELAQMSDMIGYVQTFMQKIMVKGKDYDTLPQTKKPTILKPGAEKLAFAFRLSPVFKVAHREYDPFKTWEYEKPAWNNGRRDGFISETARGYYFYEVTCDLVHESGRTWASAIGCCDSTERGREFAPGNTILKMAEKRAFVAAILNATNSSDLFTQDLEDYQPESPKTAKPQSSAHHPDDLKQKRGPGFITETQETAIEDLIGKKQMDKELDDWFWKWWHKIDKSSDAATQLIVRLEKCKDKKV